MLSLLGTASRRAAGAAQLTPAGDAYRTPLSDDERVVSHDYAAANLDALERALSERRAALAGIESEDERTRRAAALTAFEGYTALLREPTQPAAGRNPIRYAFKLVFPDGRWSVDERELPAAPREGDVVGFEGIGNWRIEGAQRVGVKPAGKPPRMFFVCSPTA